MILKLWDFCFNPFMIEFFPPAMVVLDAPPLFGVIRWRGKYECVRVCHEQIVNNYYEFIAFTKLRPCYTFFSINIQWRIKRIKRLWKILETKRFIINLTLFFQGYWALGILEKKKKKIIDVSHHVKVVKYRGPCNTFEMINFPSKSKVAYFSSKYICEYSASFLLL